VPSFGGDACERDQDLAFQPIFAWSKHRLAELAQAKEAAIGQDGHRRDRPAQRQRHHRMPCFVVSGDLVVFASFARHSDIIAKNAGYRLFKKLEIRSTKSETNPKYENPKSKII
jgi:hypothetical protein